ncbi:MAG: choice-of-anchor J domain-containing protein, partial [Flavobacteriales bacterium]
VVQSTPGTYNWSASNQGTGNNYYGKASGWNGSAAETTELWLVSPSFNLTGATNPVLNFKNAQNFNGPDLQLKISTSYSGSGTAVPAEWIDITTLATWSQGSFAFVSSGDISLSAYAAENNLHIAFVYTSNPTDGARSWEVDDIEVIEYAEPTVMSIADVQATATGDLSDLEGTTVTVGGRVSAFQTDAGFWIQDGTGAFSGIFVFDAGDNIVAIGDSLILTGTVVEFAPAQSSVEKTTQIASLISFENVGPFSPHPQINVTSSSANQESYESMLISVTGATCNAGLDGFNEWVVNDGSGDIRVDDYMYLPTPAPVVGNVYNVTGVVSHNFGAYKILPRNMADISAGTVGIYNGVKFNEPL